MRIFVKAKAGAKENKVIPPEKKLWSEGRAGEFYIVSVKELPKDGQANFAIGKALADYFNVSSTCVKLVSGISSKIKVFEISEK